MSKKKTVKTWEITDLTENEAPLYCSCLDDWSDEMKESGDYKTRWYQQMKNKGLRVKLAKDTNGTIGGMIQYYPAQYAQVDAPDMYHIHCIWVHGHKEGRGNFQKQGMGKALIQAAEEDAMSLGAAGLTAWGLSIPVWMRASWFKKQGFKKADKNGISTLVWKKFKEDAKKPLWIKKQKSPLDKIEKKKVTITGFINGVCPVGGINIERVKKAVTAFDSNVTLNIIDTSSPGTIKEWGITDAVYINNTDITAGPPLTVEKIQKLIHKKLGKN